MLSRSPGLEAAVTDRGACQAPEHATRLWALPTCSRGTWSPHVPQPSGQLFGANLRRAGGFRPAPRSPSRAGTVTGGWPGGTPARGARRRHAPEVQDPAGRHARLGGLPLRQVVEEELAVAHHRVRPLPALLHPGRLRDLPSGGGGAASRGWRGQPSPGGQPAKGQAPGGLLARPLGASRRCTAGPVHRPAPARPGPAARARRRQGGQGARGPGGTRRTGSLGALGRAGADDGRPRGGRGPTFT